jgi:short-subunit dehydrogenase
VAATRIVITGASRGIGEALALAYAEPGTSLVLAGRDAVRLEGVAEACRAKGAEAGTRVFDIADRQASAAALAEIDASAPVDLLIANAGIQRPTQPGPAAFGDAREEIAINLLGTFDTIEPIAARMAARGRGRIAIVSSLAAYVPMADSPGYAASKAGLLSLGLSLRARLRPTGVGVSVVCPGYVDAGMGRRFKGWKPIVVSAEEAARRIRSGIARDRAVIAFPTSLALVTRIIGLLPEGLARLVLANSRFRVEAPTDDISGERHG